MIRRLFAHASILTSRLTPRLTGRAIAAVALALAMAGCDVGYITRAAYEGGRLLWKRKPISAELARPELPNDLRAKLETVLAVRKFAADKLGLKVGGAYNTVTPVDQGAIVWIVMAAPRDALAPYEWWFPIVGYVPYRGYFNQDGAADEAAAMEAQGYDTYVRSAVAFSSLGFFNDPLLSNLLELDRVELAGVIIHELFHRTFFLKSDVMFDESAATWAGSRGAVEFFSETEGADSRDARDARAIYSSDMKFAAFLLEQQARLLRLYHSGLTPEVILRQRVGLFAGINAGYASLKPTLAGLERFDLDRVKLNNAVLLNYLIYFHALDRFAALERVHHGDLRETIQAIIELAGNDPNDPFHAVWAATQGIGPARTGGASAQSAPGLVN